MKNHQPAGFSLIELMIVVAIIGLLTYFAIPSYQRYVWKSRRTQATSTLENMQLAQEKFRNNNNTYGTLTQIWGGVGTTDGGDYNLSITNITASSYTLTATAVGAQANDSQTGVTCTPMAITVNGANVTRTPSACW